MILSTVNHSGALDRKKHAYVYLFHIERSQPHLPAYAVKKGCGFLPTYRIIVDLSDRQLYLLDNDIVVRGFPVGVGAMLTQTPTGEYTIVNKQPNPGGPYGALWMGLSKPHYGIHGTNNPTSIGKQVSLGCIRMHNEDVLELSELVPVGTRVTIRQ